MSSDSDDISADPAIKQIMQFKDELNESFNRLEKLIENQPKVDIPKIPEVKINIQDKEDIEKDPNIQQMIQYSKNLNESVKKLEEIANKQQTPINQNQTTPIQDKTPEIKKGDDKPVIKKQEEVKPKQISKPESKEQERVKPTQPEAEQPEILKELNNKENPFNLAKTIMLSEYLSKMNGGEETKRMLGKMLMSDGYVKNTIKTNLNGYLSPIGEVETPLDEQSRTILALEIADKTIKTINNKGLRTKLVNDYLTNIKKQATPEAYALIALQVSNDYGANIEDIKKGKNIGPVEELIMTMILKQEARAMGLDNGKTLLDELLKQELSKKAYNQLVKMPETTSNYANTTSKASVKA